MKVLFTMLCLLAAALTAQAGERVMIYVLLLEKMPAELSDGSVWQMDKGDCFPVVAYKESHTKVILQLAGVSFAVATNKTRVLEEKEVPAGLATYRANVNTFINGFAQRWRAAAEAGKPE